MNKIRTVALAAGLLLSASQGFAGSGASQYDPVMPDTVWVSNSTQTPPVRFTFQKPQSGLWFDPPMVDGFQIYLSNGYFTSVTAPDSFNGLQLKVGGVVVDSDFRAGETYSFWSGVTSFEVRNVHPAIDSTSPNVATALPLKLSFFGASQMAVSAMYWDAIPASVPETDIYLMMIGGLAALGLLKRRRR